MDIVLMKKGLRITAVAIAVIAGILTAYLVAPGHVFASTQEQKAEGDPEIYECKSEVGERITLDMIPGEKKSGLSLDYVPTKYIPTVVIVIGLDNTGYDKCYDWSEVVNTDSVSGYFRYVFPEDVVRLQMKPAIMEETETRIKLTNGTMALSMSM